MEDRRKCRYEFHIVHKYNMSRRQFKILNSKKSAMNSVMFMCFKHAVGVRADCRNTSMNYFPAET
jgi:hypothetical protein